MQKTGKNNQNFEVKDSQRRVGIPVPLQLGCEFFVSKKT